MTFNSYIICGTPRSGSTLLCDLLSATGTTGHPNSYFRRQSMPEWAAENHIDMDDPNFDRRYLTLAKQLGTKGKEMFGLRLMWGSLPELMERLDRLFPNLSGDTDRLDAAFGTIKYLQLSRTDLVAQAVSRAKAEQSGLWHRYANGDVREQVKPFHAPSYDRAAITSYIAEAQADVEHWNTWFQRYNINPLRISYESLIANPQATLNTLLKFLGKPAAQATIKSQKLADSVSVDWIVRFNRGE